MRARHLFAAVACATLRPAAAQRLQHVAPDAFERTLGPIPLALVLLCVPSPSCSSLEAEMTIAAGTIATERLPATLARVDLSAPGADRLRTKLNIRGGAPTMLLFNHGQPSPYRGGQRAAAFVSHVRDATRGSRQPQRNGAVGASHGARPAADGVEGGSSDAAVVTLDAASFAE